MQSNKSEQIKSLLTENISFAKIAKIVGCTSEYVSVIKKKVDNPKEKTYGNLKKKIKEMHSAGYSRKQIIEELGCTKSTVSYSLNDVRKTKKTCPLTKKIHTFKKRYNETIKEIESFKLDENLSIFVHKINTFKKGETVIRGTTPNKKNVLEKFANNKNCRLCGMTCDFTNSKSYSFDHYVPKSRGGDNSLENMQLLCMQCNQMKHAMLQEEFLEKCKRIVEFNNSQQMQTSLQS